MNAFTIRKILRAANIDGMELCKIHTHGQGGYLLAEYEGREKAIHVNALGHMGIDQLIEELRAFAADR